MNIRSGYVNIDELQAGTSLGEAAAKCGVALDPTGSGKEVRIDCPFACPGDHVGRRELSINTENPQRVFLCHAYSCQFRGNLLTLMHGWLTGKRPSGDKLKGDEFNRVKRLLASEAPPPSATSSAQSQPTPALETPPATKRNLPLCDSGDDKIRELVTLDAKLITDVAVMSPAAASYVRRHPALSPESMQKWRVGYLPQDGGGDKRGWSLRGHILYPIHSEEGKVLAWVGRDPSYEQKEKDYSAIIPSERTGKVLPQKHKFPKGFHRGQELFGQQAGRLKEPGYREVIAYHGIVVVEGFNDVIGLDILGIPAVGIMSNRMTQGQLEKVANWAKQLAGGKVVLMFDCEPSGSDGAKEALWELAQRQLNVRLAWTPSMHGGKFAGRQPESLTREEWNEIVGGL